MSTILVIEDDHTLREGLVLLFEIEGYQTLGTSNGVGGIELARKRHPDLIITNCRMPGADGFEVMKTVRESPESADIPIVFLTADHAPSVRERAVREGADAFVTKPFQIDELTTIVAQLLADSEHEYS